MISVVITHIGIIKASLCDSGVERTPVGRLNIKSAIVAIEAPTAASINAPLWYSVSN